MNPHKLCWGFARTMPFAEIVAVTVLLGVVLSKDKERRFLPMCAETWLLLGLWAQYTLTTVLAWYPDEAWPQWDKVSKILLFTFLTIFYLQTRDRIRVMFLTVALSLGFYGVKGGIWSFRTLELGSSHVMGPDSTFIGGNTEMGLALVMILPFLLILARKEPRQWLRKLMVIAFCLTIVAAIFTYSRGAMIGLPVVLAMLFLRAQHRVIGIVGIIIFYVFMSRFPPQEWFDRMQTIQTYEADRSAQMRLESWQVAWKLGLDYPFTGGGFWVLPHDEVFDKYLKEYIRSQSAHSIYFAVLGDHGFVGLGLFVSTILTCFISLTRVKWSARNNPDAEWVVDYCQIVETSLMAYVISGAFLTLAYWDLFYHLVSFVIILKAIYYRDYLPVSARTKMGFPNVSRMRIQMKAV
jgi:probable O-glycosylation ligase (exosortase A-associated)